jgi:hypothetical protein
MVAAQLGVLCYLDTLLTSLVVDKMIQERDQSNEVTNKAKELGKLLYILQAQQVA